MMRRILLAILLGLWGAHASAAVRIKDIADVEGVRDNQLVGYGLVVGLNGTGDRLDSAVFTRQSLIGMLERLGVNTRDQETKLQTKNVAAVMVTATLPAFARGGSRIDVSVSALGDAKDLTGGTLLVTPLMGAAGEVYSVAQGALSTGAISALRSKLDVTGNDDQGIQGANSTISNIVDADGNTIAYDRTTAQVLNIVYGQPSGSKASSGLFFPNGMNGNIRVSG